MIVCHCTGTTDRDLRAAADRARGSSAEVERRCGAGSGCGGCRPAIRALLAEMAQSGQTSAARARRA